MRQVRREQWDASKLTMHSDLGTNAAVEFCVTLKGKGKAQKVAAFESLATARMWTGGAGATAVAQGQQWIGRPVRKNFDGVVHEGSVIAFDSAEGMFAIKYADGDQEDVKLDELMEITGAADRAADPTAVSRRPTRASGGLAVPDSHHN